MKTDLKEKVLGNILYTKDKDGTPEVTERTILPTNIPHANIKAFDVTDMTDDQREVLAEYYEEYQKYFKTQMKTIFSFDDWIDATHPMSVFSSDIPEDERAKVKYRTFKIDNIQIVE